MLYPLRFRPIYRRYLWGGRRLASVLGKSIGPEDNYAESWEIVDRLSDQSIVENGSLTGWTLADLVVKFGADLVGQSVWSQIADRDRPVQLRNRFPLLLKFLDANKTLSVQVHPNDELAQRASPPDLGKTEAWYVIQAEPGSVIYAGLKPGVDARQLRDAATSGSTDQVLHQFEARPGQCVYVPSGTVHAIGAGLVIAEIQQASDTTYRLFDWNRLDDQGKPRALHVDEAIEATDFHRGPVDPVTPDPADKQGCATLLACPAFQLNRWNLNGGGTVNLSDRFRLLAILDGTLNVAAGGQREELPKGQTMLIPACLEQIEFAAQEPVEFLEISIP